MALDVLAESADIVEVLDALLGHGRLPGIGAGSGGKAPEARLRVSPAGAVPSDPFNSLVLMQFG